MKSSSILVHVGLLELRQKIAIFFIITIHSSDVVLETNILVSSALKTKK